MFCAGGINYTVTQVVGEPQWSRHSLTGHSNLSLSLSVSFSLSLSLFLPLSLSVACQKHEETKPQFIHACGTHQKGPGEIVALSRWPLIKNATQRNLSQLGGSGWIQMHLHGAREVP